MASSHAPFAVAGAAKYATVLGGSGKYDLNACPHCYGTKEPRLCRQWRLFKGVYVDYFYLFLITSVFGDVTFYRPRGHNSPIYFTAGAVDGILMPVKFEPHDQVVNEVASCAA